MKVNEMPEKIYIHVRANKELGTTWHGKKITNSDIEYVRKDAFIEEAYKWINKELPITDLSPSNMLDITFKVFDKECKKVFIEDFKNYERKVI